MHLRFTVPPIFSGEEIERAIRILAAGERSMDSESEDSPHERTSMVDRLYYYLVHGSR